MLTEKERRFLDGLSSRHRYTLIAGIALFCVGGLYAIWSVQQLDPERAPIPHEAFDRPIARLALLAANYQEWVKEFTPQNEREKTLLKELKAQADLTVRLMLALLRFALGSMVITAGVILFTLGLTQRQFLRIARKLRRV